MDHGTHGASGAQTAQNAFTAQSAPQAKFYKDNQYPKRIRANETSTGIDKNDHLHIVIRMMDQLWVSEDPTQYIKDLYSAAYNDHQSLK
ncbi:glucan endo-1-6-beta-glucosidase B [Penicillium diatomitis]|uniref:Glucan endo-1-6-beta-glucosidase B n=1 Tax=Penicillium diatomitis TaxID=2819901 RepID=A0A9W9X781_9EURO|nr:glucan endo-1-6-beta-glucosidase B [Penicillium diatomitis]KAJ5485592.1 glucan endo-1-6-beta-glucosidase B [Penicillium diatomitis]